MAPPAGAKDNSKKDNSKKRRSDPGPPGSAKRAAKDSSAKRPASATKDQATAAKGGPAILPTASLKRPTRAPTAAQLAVAAAAKRRNEAVQHSIVYDPKNKYPIGLKLLLDDSIYANPSAVHIYFYIDW